MSSSQRKLHTILRPSLLADPAERSNLAAAYAAGTPYPHCVIPDLCDPLKLRAVRDEIINNIEATYKETDLFKMLQTGDLANMDALDATSAWKLKTLLSLRDALYSPEFRAFVSEITGCGELSDRTDCACNIHPFGGHLLCHDDVIGDRRVSFIVYLTDPEDPWRSEDGGALELYPAASETPHMPDTTPTATVLPVWNSMAMFTVEPGRSFHSIQEVFTTEKPRMSIQGWYHAPTAPDADAAAMATLRQLQANPGEEDMGEYGQFMESTTESNLKSLSDRPTDAELTEADVAALSEWINPVYLGRDAASKVQARFQEEGSVQLQNFLKPDRAEAILKATALADEAAGVGGGNVPEYAAGCSGCWRAVGPAHKQRYLRYSESQHAEESQHVNGGVSGTSTHAGEELADPAEVAGRLLTQVHKDLFSSGAFARLVRRLTTVTMLGQRSQVRRFRPGLDYTVAHYGGLTRDPRLDAVLCFVNDSSQAAKAAWDSGEVGGFEAYLLADEDEERPAEVYRAGADDETGVLNVSAASNSLNLVLRDEGLMRFVKYVSAAAPGSRWDVAAVFLPDNEDEDGEELDQDEDEDEKV
jgi:prolyl 3-hydroxylase /prolyl 3,4-dihydroxylase